MRVDIRTGYGCQNRCWFCPQGDLRATWPSASISELRERVRAARALGDQLVLSGGEPTLHPDLLPLVRFAHGLGFREIELQTNGRLLASKAAATALFDAGVSRVSPALHGDSAKLHDALTREPGSFRETVAAIRALGKTGIRVVVHTLILAPNLARLPRVAELASALGASAMHLGLVNTVGDVEHAFDELVPHLSQLPPMLERTVRIAERLGLSLTLDGVPPCIAAEHAALSSDADDSTTVHDVPLGAAQPLSASRRRRQGPICESCAARGHCPGIWSLYAARRGFDELVPLSSYQHTPVREDGAARADRPLSELAHRHLDVIAGSAAQTIGVEHDRERDVLSIVIRTPCNNRCDFCTTRIMHEETATAWDTVDEAANVLTTTERYRQLGARRAVFVAMEPLEHPQICEIVRGCRAQGYSEVELWTNARRLCDPAFARALVDAGVTQLRVPFFGATASVHDRVTTMIGSFDESVAGIRNIRAAGLSHESVSLCYLVVKKNHHELVDFLSLAEREELGSVVDYDIGAPSSADLRFYEPIAMRLDDVALELSTRLASAPEHRQFVLNRVRRWLPPCVALRHFGPEIVAQYPARAPGRQLAIRMVDAAEGAETGAGRGGEKKVRVACDRRADCAAGAVCPGYFSHYVELHGHTEFEPLLPAAWTAGAARQD